MAEELIDTHVTAIKEYCEQLDDCQLPYIECQGLNVFFTVIPFDPKDKQDFVLRLQSQYPSSAGTLVLDEEHNGNEFIDLTHINDIIGRGCTVGSALAQLGKVLNTDLGWAQEAVLRSAESEVIEMYEEEEEEEEDADLGVGVDDDDAIFIDDACHGGIQEVRDWSEKFEELIRLEQKFVRSECSTQTSSQPAPPDEDLMRRREAAFRLLADEFQEFYMSTDRNMLVEHCGGIFTWRVTMGGFHPQSSLDSDLFRLGETKGVSVIDFEIKFESLYPAYPPSVRLISPRMKGRIMDLVASHPLLQRKNWNVEWRAKNVINLVRAILQMKGRVNFDSTIPYSEAEFLLVRLHALKRIPHLKPSADPAHVFPEEFKVAPQGDAQHGGSDSNGEHRASKRAKTSAEDGMMDERKSECVGGAVVWKAGTGYGVGNHYYGDRDRDNRKKSNGKEDILIGLINDLESEVLHGVMLKLAKEIDRQFSGRESNSLRRSTVFSALEESCLIPYLYHYLCTTSISDIFAAAKEIKFCTALVCCIQSLIKVVPILWTPITRQENTTDTVADKFVSLAGLVSTYLCVMLHSTDAETDQAGSVQQHEEEHSLEQLFLKVANEISSFNVKSSGVDQNTVNGDGTDEEALYVRTLAPYKLQILPGIAANHMYLQMSKEEPHKSVAKRARKVAAHLADLDSYLPINTSSSIFVVADEQQTILWKAMIIGPKDTPYEGGAFLFDIYFDQNYPEKPPRVNFRTTGGGSVRFNPNLYECGKVCLSLLNTWGGNSDERWISSVSTVMQVLTSIQGLIFVEEPYYNEPGYERRKNDARSNEYNASRMYNTIKWGMIDQLRSPPPYFADVIRSHFKLRGNHIIAKVKEWKDFIVKWRGGSVEGTNSMTRELEELISKL